jgi:hypothetical protein
VQVDTISTVAGQVVTVVYAGVGVSDGQLTLRLQDLGGIDANVVINGLQVIWAGPDTFGPRVIAASPSGNVTAPVDRLLLTFDEPLLPGSFSLADIVSLTGPTGAIVPTAVQAIDARQFEVRFAAQNAVGEYRLTIGPDIADQSGNLMDQDRDGVGGELLQDQYTTGFNVVPFMGRFDFGTATSPVEAGYVPVLPTTTYSAALGYGWQGATGLGVVRNNGTALTRDLIYAPVLTFAVDVPNGTYDVTLTTGDTDVYPHDLMGIFLEGVQVDTISTVAGQVVTVVYAGVGVSDGQLTLRLQDFGGVDPNIVINGLQIGSGAAPAQALLAGYRPTAASPRLQSPRTRQVLLERVDAALAELVKEYASLEYAARRRPRPQAPAVRALG